MRRWSLALVLLAACGPKPPVRTALHGNLADLKRDIQAAQQAGTLSQAGVVELARAVAERELTSAQGSAGALRVRSLRACALPLRRAMERRSHAEDDVAAELTLILLEEHAENGAELLKQHARSSAGAFRAVAARAALRASDTDRRRAFYVDPDQRVRRAALTAARQVHDARELETLLEVARVDPDPESQSLAVRAVGAIGGERAVLALKDIWVKGDDSLRIAIVDAWSEPASFVAGGARELAWAAESGGGLAAVSASYALVRSRSRESIAALARLHRNILEGSDDEKRLALNVVPAGPETEAVLLKAAHDASPELRVVALWRLSNIPARRELALHSLRELAQGKPGSDAEQRAQTAALAALAEAGDSSVRAALLSELKNPILQTRWRAARSLSHLGDYPAVAPALADDDADLRTDIACSILSREARQN